MSVVAEELSTHALKRKKRHLHRSAVQRVLKRDDLLDRIFDTLGKGHWLFVAGVSRRWRGRYFRMCDQMSRSGARLLITDLNNGVLSTSCLSLAFETNEALDPDRLGDFFLLAGAKGRPVSVEVLALARVYGMDWNTNFAHQAAASGDLARLQWLVKHRCPYQADMVAQGAAYSGNLAMLKWIKSTTATWDFQNLGHVLAWAGLRNNVEVAKWLLAEGAQWPMSALVNVRFLIGAAADIFDCWEPAFVAWALANGWDWGDWNCLATVQLVSPHCPRFGAKHAALRDWAHAHNCPCRCGTAAGGGGR